LLLLLFFFFFFLRLAATEINANGFLTAQDNFSAQT
jgi:hypothetical protein